MDKKRDIVGLTDVEIEAVAGGGGPVREGSTGIIGKAVREGSTGIIGKAVREGSTGIIG